MTFSRKQSAMKLLMFLAKQFTFRPFEKTLPDAGDASGEVRVADAAVIFVHSEPQDEAEPDGLETKFVKNVKWIAGKACISIWGRNGG